MRIILIIILVNLLFMPFDSLAIAQESPADTLKKDEKSVDSLRVWRSFFSGSKYSYRGEEGKVWSGGPVKSIVENVPFAVQKVETFEKYQVQSTFLGFLSGSVIGYGLGIKIFGKGILGGDKDTANTLILVGIGGLLISSMIDLIGYSHLKKGVKIFNESQTRLEEDQGSNSEE